MSDESRYFSRDEELVFGDFPAIENRINSDSLDFCILFIKKKYEEEIIIIINIINAFEDVQ